MVRALVSVGAMAMATALLCGAALYNRFPLVWYDTSSHVGDPITGHMIWARTIVYGLFLYAFHLRVTLWAPIVAQAAIAAYVVHATVRAVLGRVGVAPYLAVAAALAVGSSLPWFAGQLMPDVFTGLVVLGLFVLVCGGPRVAHAERLAVVAITALAIAVHVSHVPLAAGLLVVVAGARGRAGGDRGAPRRRLGPALGSLALAIAAITGANLAYRGSLALSPYGSIFLLARFVEDGPAVAYHREHCPEAGYRLCAFVDDLPVDVTTFLWRDEGPLARAGGADALRDEARAIVAGSVARAPWWHLRLLARHTGTQLTRFTTGAQLDPYLDEPGAPGRSVAVVIRDAFPASYPRYLASRQNTATLPLASVRWLHRRVLQASVVVTLVCVVVAWRRGQRRFVSLVAMAVTGLAGNAMVTGPLSAPIDRYQSRVIWLVVLCALLGPLALVRRAGAAEREGRVAGSTPADG